MSAPDFVVRLYDDPAQVDAQAWNDLLGVQQLPTPFMRHEYLLALHASDSACAFYVKTHSFGEYVFDWAWADAYERHGLPYYPKLVCAVPFTPVPGSRLLARGEPARQSLLHTLRGIGERARLSSVHLLFTDEADRRTAADAGWLMRQTVQFHWLNRQPQPYADFDEFLGSLQRDKRKKIAQERRRVADAGVSFTVHAGAQIDTALWDFFHHCYTLTYAAHHATPYLTRDFFARMQDTMARHWVMFAAERNGRRLACSLIAVDPERGHAWGRYWGCTEFVPCLHFEACYYQPLAWCIAQRYRRFEGGAQGCDTPPLPTPWRATCSTKAQVWPTTSMNCASAVRSASAEPVQPRRLASKLAMPAETSTRALSGPSQPLTLTHLPGSKSL